MLLYDFRCTECGVKQEHTADIEQRTVECVDCGGLAKRLITSNHFVHGDIDFVTDNITGEPMRIGSRKQLKDLEKRHEVSAKYGKGWY